MIIDGHAHACGEFLTCNSVEVYLAKHKIDKVILCGGEPGSSKNYRYPMLSDLFKGEKLGYVFNKIISRVTKLSHAADHIDEILGSDTPNGIDNVEKVHKRLRELTLTDKQRSLIMGGNLLRILNL